MTSPITSAPAPRAASIAMNRWTITVIVLLHAVVSVLHGNAHTSLGVGLSSWQQTYVLLVIVIAPFVAGVLAWTRWMRLALLVLLFSMAGSLIFGACYHYLIVSPDNVAHLPAGEARGMFRSTAMLLFVTESLGVIVALLGLRASRT
jgi:hypothetical protein